MGYAEQLLTGRQRSTLYTDPGDFLIAAADYFQWCEDHPILEEQVNVWQGSVVRTDLKKCRAFTKTGLANHLGISVSRLTTYKEKGDDWAEVMALIEQVIYTQKFEQAAAGTLNASIVTRDLGLADKQDFSSSDGTMASKPTVIEFVSPEIDENDDGDS